MLHIGVVLHEDAKERLQRLGTALSTNAVPFQLAFQDHSFSALRRIVEEAFPRAQYTHSPQNPGFGAGHNALMERAFAVGATDYVALNPDALPHPDCLQALLTERARHPKAGLIEARQFPDEHPKPYDPKTHHTPWASGCMVLVTKALFESVGGFDEQFFLYCEDVDYSWRARAAGFVVAIAPDALVHHYADGRPPGAGEAHQMLSGAYLARKYNHRAFEEACLARYRELTHKDAAVPAPPSVEQAQRFAATKAALKLADFEHGFAFAEKRW